METLGEVYRGRGGEELSQFAADRNSLNMAGIVAIPRQINSLALSNLTFTTGLAVQSLLDFKDRSFA